MTDQVKGISNIVRLPRLGKIRLGEKVRKVVNGREVEYPRATEWFVCPPEVQAVFGEKPTELRVAFPGEDERVFARQSYSYYSLSRGLLCRGNGGTALRLLDTTTGALPTETSKKVEMRPWPCHPKHEEGEENQELCPEFTGEGYKAPQCGLLMQLQVLLPEVPGLGVWQIDTGSFYGIVGLNSCLAMLRGLTGGRVGMIPVSLRLSPQEVQVDGKKKTVRTLRFIVPLSLAQLSQALALPPLAALLPEPEAAERELEPGVDGEPAAEAEPVSPVGRVVEAQAKAEAQPPAPKTETPVDEALAILRKANPQAPKATLKSPLMPSEPPLGDDFRYDTPPDEQELFPPASKVPEVGLRKVLRGTLQKRWPDKPDTWAIFFRDIVGPDCKTVEQVPSDLLVEVIQKATPKERPPAKKGA